MSKECFICGRRGAGMHEHHVVEQGRGGSDEPENVYTLCGGCHSALHKMYDQGFYERLGVAEQRVEAFVDVEDSIEGQKIDREQSPDRQLPVNSPHLTYELVEEGEGLIHCGYCNSAFHDYEHALAAKHLRIIHRIEDPYETVSIDELVSGQWSFEPPPTTDLGAPSDNEPSLSDDKEDLQHLLDDVDKIDG